jgi:hypothetical protein
MLPLPVRIHRPDLQGEVQAVLHQLRAPAGQRLPLAELVRLLGIRVAPAFQAQLAARGDLHLDEQQFRNEGPAIQRRVRLVGVDLDLQIPPSLHGQLDRPSAGVGLRFDPGASVRLGRLLMRLELRALHLDADGIRVDFGSRAEVHVDVR